MKKILHHKDFKLYFTLFVILLVGILLRFYDTPNQYSFDGDAIRDAIVAHEGAKHFYIPLSGPFSSTGPFTFGPWYYYSLILAAFLVPNPYSPWILMGVVSLLSIGMMYKIGVLLESRKLGLLLAAITAIAPTQIFVGTALSNISPVPFFTILSIWLILLTLKSKPSKPILTLIGIALGLGINAHFQAAGLLFLPVLLWFYKGWKNFKIPLFIGIGLALTFIPLFLFNLQSEWYTVRGLQHTYSLRDQIYVPNSWKIYLLEYWPSYLVYMTNAPKQIILPVILGIIALFSFNLFKKKLPAGIVLLMIIFSINFINLRFYWGERNFVYLSYLEPIILILIGFGLLQLLKFKYGKYLLIAVLAIFTFTMLTKDYKKLQTPPSNQLVTRNEIAAIDQAYPNKNISIYTCTLTREELSNNIAFLLSFAERKEQGNQKIGVIYNTKCAYPKTQMFNYKEASISAMLAPRFYPLIPKSTAVVNFSVASESAIQTASWSLFKTEDVYKSTLRWWENKDLL
jgi:4-amino-4-deoxy-L-arabinose transferase-like glycosyltransferase